MKAAFIGNEELCRRVYTEETRERLAALCGPIYAPALTREKLDELRDELRDTEYLFSTWGMLRLTVEEIRHYFPSLRALFYGAGTVKDFGAEFLQAGVRLFSAWAANAVPVAEYTEAQIVLAGKGFYSACRTYRGPASHAAARTVHLAHSGNYDTRIGLLGLGMIGTMVAERLKDYRYEILAFDPFCPPEKAERLGVRLTSLAEIFSTCDIISNHLANKPEIEGILNRELFFSMKDNATFINTGRGAQVDEAALSDFMRSHPLATAVLDVTDPEPVEEGSPLLSAENIFLTPHIAGSAGREVERLGDYMLDECTRMLNGEPCPWEVTEAMLKTMA